MNSTHLITKFSVLTKKRSNRVRKEVKELRRDSLFFKCRQKSRCSTPNRFIWGFGVFGSFRLPQMTRRNLYLAHSVVICKQSRGLKQNGSSGVSNARMEAWLREEVVLGHMFKCTKLRDTSSRAVRRGLLLRCARSLHGLAVLIGE